MIFKIVDRYKIVNPSSKVSKTPVVVGSQSVETCLFTGFYSENWVLLG